jgi:phage-related tail fiber protein
MQRIATATRAPDLWGVGKAGFKEGDVLTGDPATSLSAAWFNNTQEEICNVIEGAGLVLNADDRTQLQQAIQALIAAASGATAVPAGAVAHFARSTVPSGWLEANGAAVSRTTYATLFAAIGTTFGGGNGTTTFNLPDLRGEFIRGYDNGRGVDSGRGFGTAQGDELRSHSHSVTLPIANDSSSGSDDESISTLGGSQTYGTSNTGGNETRPRNVALLACIKT